MAAKKRSMSASIWSRSASATGAKGDSRCLESKCRTTSSAGRLGASSTPRHTRTSCAQRARPEGLLSRHSGGSDEAASSAHKSEDALVTTSGSSCAKASSAAGTSAACGSHDWASSSERGMADCAGAPGSDTGGSPMQRAIRRARMASEPMCVSSCCTSVR